MRKQKYRLCAGLVIFVSSSAYAGEKLPLPDGATVTAPSTVAMTRDVLTFGGDAEFAFRAECARGDVARVRQNVRSKDGHVTTYDVLVDAKKSFFDDVYLDCQRPDGTHYYPIRVMCVEADDQVYRTTFPGSHSQYFVCSPHAPRLRAVPAEKVVIPSVTMESANDLAPRFVPGLFDGQPSAD